MTLLSHVSAILFTMAVLSPCRGGEYTVTVVGSYQLPYVSDIRGMDFEEPSSLLFVSGEDQRFFMCNAIDGAGLGSWDLSQENGEPYGLANSFSQISINDMSDSFAYGFNGMSWSTFINPCGPDGRGMDKYGSSIWQVYRPSGALNCSVCRMDENGTLLDEWELEEIQEQCGGLTVFEVPSVYTGIAVVGTLSRTIFFYRYADSRIDFLGAADLPSGLSSPEGICFSENYGRFYLASTDPSPSITILEIDGLSLEQSTWAGIKRFF